MKRNLPSPPQGPTRVSDNAPTLRAAVRRRDADEQRPTHHKLYMEVVVPPGVAAGDVISFESLDGTLMEVLVPDGLSPGDAFVVDVTPPSPTMPPSPNAAAGRELIHALVEHSARILSVDMAPFLELHCHLFNQSEQEARDSGETLEQYEAFRLYEVELEHHFDGFVQARGFASAADCFAAIDAALVADVANQERQREKLGARLRRVQKQSRQAAETEAGLLPAFFGGGGGSGGPDDDGALEGDGGGSLGDGSDGFSADSDDDDDERTLEAMMPLLGIGDAALGGRSGAGGFGGSGGAAGSHESGSVLEAPLTLFSQPVLLDDLISQALSLSEYPTFSSIMRKKAREVASRRRWLDAAGSRQAASVARRRELTSLSAPSSPEAALSRVWADIGQRLLALAPSGGEEGECASLGRSAAAQSAEELRLLAKFGALGSEPPASAHDKRELFQLLGAPLSRLVMLYPSMSATVTAALRKMQSTIAASTRLGEQRGCVDLIVDGATVAHKFMDEAEAAKDTILREDERKAENLRANM
jgi:hypothetical protein